MTEFVDMNDDCIEDLLKYCDIESIVAISQTCKKLILATRHFKTYTSYNCSIASDKDEKRVKRTIANIGKRLVALNLNVADGYKELKSIFIVRLPQMCPNLQELEIISNVSTNVVFDSVQTLDHLEHLCVRTYTNDEKVTELCAVRLARELKTLQTLQVYGTEWDHRAVINFIHGTQKLEFFAFDIDFNHYEIIVMEEFKSLCIEDLIVVLGFRELVNNGANDD